jgi:hypothetical protein
MILTNSIDRTYFTANTFITVVAIVLCFYILIYFYNQMMLARDKQLANAAQNRDPPMCPDYWDVTKPNVCGNSKKLGICRLGEGIDNQVDFNDSLFTNPLTSNYMKCQWAKTCGVTWQNIDNLC